MTVALKGGRAQAFASIPDEGGVPVLKQDSSDDLHLTFMFLCDESLAMHVLCPVDVLQVLSIQVQVRCVCDEIGRNEAVRTVS